MTIYTEAPCRLSLFGGGSDLPEFLKNNSGAVINMGINIRQRMRLTIQKDGQKFLDIPNKANPDFYKTIFKELGVDINDVGLIHECDGEIESGLGSSASAAVALVSGIYKLKGLEVDRSNIAKQAWSIEVTKQKLYGGIQDQLAAAYGGLNFWSLDSGRGLNIGIKQFSREVGDGLVRHMLLFHTGLTRTNTKIQEQFKKMTSEKVLSLRQIRNTAIQSLGVIDSQDWEWVGNLLHNAWEVKKSSNALISNPQIDKIYETAKDSGAWGGKLCGSGGGGYMFFVCSPDKQDQITRNLISIGCKPVDFAIDYTGVNSRIIT